MNLSLNEVEATAKRATRGAGYPWGLAEEAAKATRWLCAHGIDGCCVLARMLSQFDRADLEACAPRAHEKLWASAGGILCPLTTGTAISDRAADLRAGSIQLGRVAEPLMLLPFVAQSALQLKLTVSIAWDGVAAATDGSQLAINGESGTIADAVTIKTDGSIGDPVSLHTRAEPSSDVMDTLNRIAHRTYAPATEESRLLGAGAGLSDND